MDVMTEKLPLVIKASAELTTYFSNIVSIVNKLEAQLNFHTLTANWYGDEDNILLTTFDIITREEFIHFCQQTGFSEEDKIADDVVLLAPSSSEYRSYVAITESELKLLQAQPRLLSGYLAKKLTKILNLIAEKQNLSRI